MRQYGWKAILLFAVCLAAGCSIFMQPIGKHVFSPPVGWTRYPTFGGYQGLWGRDTESITLYWFDVPKEVSAANYDPTREPYYSDFHIESSRAISICGGHPARIQVYRATPALFGQHIYTEVVTKWGDTLYVARYQRWPFKPEIRAAVESLKTLCAGANGRG